MRTAAIISSSLLAITVSGAPIDLPKLPIQLSSLGLPLGSLSTGLPAIPVKPSHAFSATLPTGLPVGLPTGLPTIPKEPTAELPVENLPIRRADLPIADEALKGLKIPELKLPTLPKLPSTGDLKLPVKRADLPALPVVDGIVKDIKVPAIPSLPKLPTDAVKLPVRAELPVVNDLVESVKLPTNAVKLPTLPKLPVQNVNLPVKRADAVHVNAPVNLTVDDIIEAPAAAVPTVAVPAVAVPNVGLPIAMPTVPEVAVPVLPKVARDIKQTLPIVGDADVPLNVGEIQVGTVDKYADALVKGIKVETVPSVPSVPKVAREISQTLPVVGAAVVPLDAGKIQVGTVDKDVKEVVDGTTLNNVPVMDVIKSTTVKDLPNVGPREIKQTLPLVGGVTVPLDAGKVQVGTVDKYVQDVVKGTTTGL